MHRRAFLSTAGAIALAGCTDAADEPADPTPTTTPTETVTATPTPENSPTPTPTDEPAGTNTPPEVVIDSREWAIEGERVEAIVQNVADQASGSVTVTALWYDDEGRYLGRDSVSVPALPGETTWLAGIEARAPFAVGEFQLQLAVEPLPAMPAGVTLEEARVDAGGERIVGVIATEREEPVGLTARGVVTEATWVTHVGSVRETVPAGAEWRFAIPVAGVDARGEGLGRTAWVRVG